MADYLRWLRRLEFGSIPSAQVGVLEFQSRFWPELRELADAYGVLELATRQPALNVHTLYSTFVVSLRHGMRIGLAQLGPVCQRAGIKALLATDGGNRDPIRVLSVVMPELSQILVAHGSVRVDSERAISPLLDSPNATLVLWGEADIETYQRAGIVFRNVVVGGSLRNAFYWRTYRKGRNPEQRIHPIALVSKYSDGREDIASKPDRSRLLKLMKSHVARYCRERGLPARILVRPNLGGEPSSDIHKREEQHYREIFAGVPVSFSDPYLPYTTYLESDQSEVTIGLPTGSLTESFARGNKVLMVGQEPSLGDLYGFPKQGLFLLNEPEYALFAQRLDMIREMSTSDYAIEFQAERESMVANANSDKTISIVEDLLLRGILHER